MLIFRRQGRAFPRRVLPLTLGGNGGASASRSMSILGTIFGIGEFEGTRNQSLRGTTSKQQAYDLALLDILENDEKFLMGQVLVGVSQCLTPILHQDAIDAATRLTVATEIAQAESTSTSEKLHVLALDAIVHGRYREAATIYETILVHNHDDLLALRGSYDLYLKLGDYENILGTITRRLPSWSPNDAGYSHLLAMQAYGLQIAGKLDAAEAIAEKALSTNGNDRWAFHTMLHILEARGNANHGASYALQYKDAFENGGPLERHLYFQWALYLLDLGRYDRIGKFLETNIFPSLRTGELHSATTLCDVTQLFWRLHFAGEDTTAIRQQIYDAWKAISGDDKEGRVVFSPWIRVLCHSILACVGNESIPSNDMKEDAVDVRELELKMDTKPYQFSFPPSSGDFARVFYDVCQGFTAYSEGRYDDAARLLLPVRGNLAVLGGTPVDHEVIELLLIESASRSQDLMLAKLLLNEKLSNRPQSAQCWSTFSRVSESMGDASAVRDAQNISYVLGLGQGGHNTN